MPVKFLNDKRVGWSAGSSPFGGTPPGFCTGEGARETATTSVSRYAANSECHLTSKVR